MDDEPSDPSTHISLLFEFRELHDSVAQRPTPFVLSQLSPPLARQGEVKKQVEGCGVRWGAMLVKTDNALVLMARFLSLVLGYVGDTGEPLRRHPA
jgi:hypothetical protein